jgi:hypothetical protein
VAKTSELSPKCIESRRGLISNKSVVRSTPPHPGPSTYYNVRIIHHSAVNHSLTLLKMGKRSPETCLADSKINKIVIVASSWSFMLFNYIDDARSGTNKKLQYWN